MSVCALQCPRSREQAPGGGAGERRGDGERRGINPPAKGQRPVNGAWVLALRRRGRPAKLRVYCPALPEQVAITATPLLSAFSVTTPLTVILQLIVEAPPVPLVCALM